MMGATISLVVSAVLLASLIGIRYFELVRGKTYFPETRSKLDLFVLRAFVYVRRGLIRRGVQLTKNVTVNVLHQCTLLLLRAVRFTEGKLVAFIGYMRTRYGSKKKVSTQKPSEFLKTIVDERRGEKDQVR